MRLRPPILRDILNKRRGIPAVMVFTAISQSNWEGWSSDPSASTAVTAGTAYQYFPSPRGGEFFPLSSTLFGRNGGGPHCAFAATWAAAAGGVVLFCDCAVGGSLLVGAGNSRTGSSAIDYSAGTWDLAQATNHYDVWAKQHMLDALKAAERAGFDVVLKVNCCAIGETDGSGSSNGTSYTNSFVALIDKLSQEIGIKAFFLSELGTNGSNGDPAPWQAIRAAQANVVAARPSLITMAFSGAKDFYGAGKMVDDLHYTQAGYNEMGAAMATAGLAFLGGVKLPAAPMSKYYELAKALPPVTGFKRMLIDTARVGSVNPQFYSDPITPFAVTWMESTGGNTLSTAQSVSWTLPSGPARIVCAYIPDSMEDSGSLVLGDNMNAIRIRFPDGAVKINTFNTGGTNAITSNFQMTSDDLNGFDASTLRQLLLGIVPNITITNAHLTRYSGLTHLIINQSSGSGTLDLSLVPNLVRFDQENSGRSAANINTYLVQLDANGKSNGYTSLNQTPTAAPSGAGATAKSALQGKGWTVLTD